MPYLWPGVGGPQIAYISPPPQKIPKVRTIALLGATGSIGRSVLAVAKERPEMLHIAALAGGKNSAEMARQANLFKPRLVCMADGAACRETASLLSCDPELLQGPLGFAKLAALEECNTVVLAQGGASGIYGALAAALAGKIIALANKESLVMAGPLIRAICKKSGAAILPVDSEHNAIFQCLAGRGQNIRKIILTASGGPFFGKRREELQDIAPAEALRHPTWNMGAKISIDSSTLMNKTLELIEAAQLFGVAESRIEIVVQPQSVIHSMVEMTDKSILAQLAAADMRLPIAFCLFWPKVIAPEVPSVDFSRLGRLDFALPDEEVFRAISLGREALRSSPSDGLSAPCIILNAANEICVELFLRKKISWTGITANAARAMSHFVGIRLTMPDLPHELPASLDEIAHLALELAEPIMVLDEKVKNWVRANAVRT